jgi:hypothetical protein
VTVIASRHKRSLSRVTGPVPHPYRRAGAAPDTDESLEVWIILMHGHRIVARWLAADVTTLPVSDDLYPLI